MAAVLQNPFCQDGAEGVLAASLNSLELVGLDGDLELLLDQLGLDGLVGVGDGLDLGGLNGLDEGGGGVGGQGKGVVGVVGQGEGVVGQGQASVAEGKDLELHVVFYLRIF